jgi:hypothetical protein
MVNYTITRHTEADHTYGCTNFSTIQEEGQVASTFAGATLDATIEWDLEALPNYEVNVEDFEFVGATVVSANNPAGTYVWKDLPSPILGATMEQVSSILIKITLYLAPSAFYPGFNSGTPFEMPNNDVDINVEIEGCAKLKGEGVHINIGKMADPNTTTRVDIEGDLAKKIVANEGDTRDSIHGTLPTKKEGENGEQALLMSYNVVAKDGYRYKSAPTLSFTNKNYHVTRRTTTTQNPIDPTKKDITSVSFDIYKK